VEERKDEVQIHKCPHCGKCCAIADECDDAMFVDFHKLKPPRRPYAVRLLTQRRCAKCKNDFMVEVYTSISTLLRWLIFNDPDALAREIFEENEDLIDKLREDKKFMALINKTD